MTPLQGSDPRVLPVEVRRGVRALFPVLVLLLLLLAAGTAAVARTGWPGSAAQAQPERTQALVLSGSSLSYPAARRLTDGLGWDARVYVVPGGGISRSTLDPSGSITAAARRLLPAGGPAPDVVLVQGGEADHSADPETLHNATSHLLDYVLAHTAQAEVVLIGPIPGAVVPPSVRAVNDVLQGVADSRGVRYVDVVAGGWQAGDPALLEELRRVLVAG